MIIGVLCWYSVGTGTKRLYISSGKELARCWMEDIELMDGVS